MFQYKNWILPTVPHGITDIIDSPEKTLAVYSTIGPFILNMNDENKQIILLISSIYHMRKDVPFGILGSAYMHDIWLKQPEIAVLFLSFIHTPRHYMRSFKYKKKEISCVYFWDDGTKFIAYSDSEKFATEASKTFNEPKEKINKYIKRAKKKYDLIESIFLEK